MGWTRFRLPGDVQSPLGEIPLAGEVSDDVPHVPGPYRRMGNWILSVVTAGTGSYRDEHGGRHPIGPGGVLLVPPGRPHWYGTDGTEVDRGGRWSELFVVFGGALFDTLHAAGTLAGRLPTPADPLPSIERLRAVVSAEPVDRPSLDRRLIALCGWLADLRAADEPAATDDPEGRLQRAARQLAADTRADLDLHVLATEVGVGYDAFRRRFRALHGRPPAAYRNDARLEAAAQLLRLTDLAQHEIARRLGFSDEFHLSRRFRERYGMPPGRYRRAG